MRIGQGYAGRRFREVIWGFREVIFGFCEVIWVEGFEIRLVGRTHGWLGQVGLYVRWPFTKANLVLENIDKNYGQT